MNKVERAILRGASDPLTRGLIIAFYEGLLGASDQLGIAPDLNSSLFFLQAGQAPAFFLFRDLIVKGQGGSIGPPGVLEAEQRIVLYFVQQGERLLEVRFGLARKSH